MHEFEKLYWYPDGKKAEELLNRARLKGTDYKFTAPFPQLPLKHKGKLWTTGWDIPILWVIDCNNEVWADDAHGDYLRKMTHSEFLSYTETEEARRILQKLLSLPVDCPSWQITALENGWIPPDKIEEV